MRGPYDVAKGTLDLPHNRSDFEHPARALPVDRYFKSLTRAVAYEAYQLVEAVDFQVVQQLATSMGYWLIIDVVSPSRHQGR